MMAMLATRESVRAGRPTAAFGVLRAPGWTVREIPIQTAENYKPVAHLPGPTKVKNTEKIAP
jgi:hypothetical protein